METGLMTGVVLLISFIVFIGGLWILMNILSNVFGAYLAKTAEDKKEKDENV